MAKLELVGFWEPVLREKARTLSPEEILSPEIQELAQNMHETIRKGRIGVGLAAPQVGRSVALATLQVPNSRFAIKSGYSSRITMFNPEITDYSGEKKAEVEHCLTYKDELGLYIWSYPGIEVVFLDENAQEQNLPLVDHQARAVQHEVDHLDGILTLKHHYAKA